MTTAPAFSFITATYQCARYLRRCHWSLTRQTLSDWEWVLVDDASTDGTADLIAGLGDARIRYHRLDTNQGRGLARDFALRQARGRWLAVQDADDFSLPGRLRRAEEAWFAGFDFLGSALVLIDQDYRVNGVRGCSPRSEPRIFPHATLCGEANLLRRIGYPAQRWAEDQTMVLTIANTRSGDFAEEPLYVYHENASTRLRDAFWSQHSARKQLLALERAGTLPRSAGLKKMQSARFWKMVGLLPFFLWPVAYRKTLGWRSSHDGTLAQLSADDRAFIAECARLFPLTPPAVSHRAS
ncbi:MAG: glycosyltransferase [Opitutaceae bacterium]